MRLSKEEINTIDEFIGDRPEIRSDDLSAFVRSVIPVPDVEMLKEQYYHSVGQRRIRLRRDVDRVRVYFSTGEHRAEKYINAETTLDADKVKKAEELQIRQVKQTVKNIRKLRNRRSQLDGQTSLFDAPESVESLVSDILEEQQQPRINRN